MLAMLVADYYIGTSVWNITNGIPDFTITWILRTATIITILAGTFAVPLLVSTGKNINPFNGLKGILYMIIVIPVVMTIGIYIWNFATLLLTGQFLIITELTIILTVLGFAYAGPLLIMFEDFEMGSDGGSFFGQKSQQPSQMGNVYQGQIQRKR